MPPRLSQQATELLEEVKESVYSEWKRPYFYTLSIRFYISKRAMLTK